MLRGLPGRCALSAVALCVALSACGGNDDEAQFGAVEVTLLGVAADGSIYRLQDGTYLRVVGGRFNDLVPVDAWDESVITVPLPIGPYTWRLEGTGQTGVDGVWTLFHEDSQGNPGFVEATLLNTQPEAFQVLPDTTTSLVLDFEAGRGGTIRFAQGAIDVTMDVTETDVFGGIVTVSSAMTATFVTLSQSAHPDLAGRLPAAGEGPFILDITERVAGPWEPTSIHEVCAPLSIEGWVVVGGPPRGQASRICSWSPHLSSRSACRMPRRLRSSSRAPVPRSPRPSAV